MTADTYRPISCDFHDILEATATRRARARIVFLDEDGGRRTIDARIVDLGTGVGGEYMTLQTGEVLRLDRIVSVDDARLASFATHGPDAADD